MLNDTEQKRDYRGTLNLPLSDKAPGAFPQEAKLRTREVEFQTRWEEQDLYRRSLEKDAPKGSFILHDGPPYSNGAIHLGHALNKIAKDIITRLKTMQGYRAPYVPGWDNHGMPIENAVARRYREEKRAVDRVTLRKSCREYAEKWVEVQRGQFKRLGIRGDWANPYLTMTHEFEARIVEVFGDLAAQGFIYRGLKPVLWCATCETALADAEVEYEDHTSRSITVRFPLGDDPNGVFGAAAGEAAFATIWTTTPWTLPANLALAVHPDADYAVVRATHPASAETAAEGEPAAVETAVYLVALPLLESVMTTIGATEYSVVRTIGGSALHGLVFRHPLFDRPSPVLLADYVTMDTGTGIVHTAPGHGKEDFETGQRYELEVLNPVDASGRYTALAGSWRGRPLEGLHVIPPPHKRSHDSEANTFVLQALAEAGALLDAGKLDHSYPHCWRCHSPLIFRATVQWFMNIDHADHRERCLDAILGVTWYPKESINRITTMVGNRPDWCVSRQRSWGVGIPAFYCDACGDTILTEESVASVAALTRDQGSDAWYARTLAEILPEGFRCPHCGGGVERLRKETDVLDVWFDSGSTHRAVLENHAQWPDLSWPANLYLEGGDQHRGWFNSSLMIAVATRGRAPYDAVITNGWTLDENGEAFSKSKGNGVDPLAVIDKYGADVLRCWVASQDFMEDTRCGEHLLKQVSETYRRIRNTFRFLLNNLYDFDPAEDAVPEAEMLEMDLWALQQLNHVVGTAVGGYEAYEFQRVYHAVHNFCTVELSAFYLDVIKDRLYASPTGSFERRSAQTALHRLAETLARLLAPILVHTAEEVWDHLKIADKPASVHLADLPTPGSPDRGLIERWEPIIAMREMTRKAVEAVRVKKEDWEKMDETARAGFVVNPLEARIELSVDEETYGALKQYAEQLSALFVVSQVELTNAGAGAETAVRVSRATGTKCGRCWLIKSDVGESPEHPSLCVRCASAVETQTAGS